MNVNAVKPKNLRIKITTANIEAGIDQARGQRAFASGHVKQRTAWLILQNADHRVVNGLMGERRGRCERSLAAVLFKR